MTTIRCLLSVAAGCAFGCAAGFLILGLGHTAAGVAIAVCAALVMVRECVVYVQRRRRRPTWHKRIEAGLAGARPVLPNRGRR